MTGNNKFWRASLAGLASVAMLATMGVAASTANAAAATVDPYNFTITLHANSPEGVQTAATVNGDDTAKLDGYKLDTADGKPADSKFEGLYTSAAGWRVNGPTGWTFTGWYTSPEYGSEKFDFKNTTVTKNIDLYAHWAEPDQFVNFTFYYGSLFNAPAYSASDVNATYASSGSNYEKLTVAKQDKKIAAWELPTDVADGYVVDTWKTGTDTVTLDDLTKDFSGKLQGFQPNYKTDESYVTLTPVAPAKQNASTVKYERADGTSIADAVDVKYGEAVPTSPKLSGNKLVTSWVHVDPTSGEKVAWKDGETASEAYQTLTLIASGSSTETFTVTYVTEVNGNWNTVVATEYVAKGESPKGAFTPSRDDNYTFAGWSETSGYNQKTVDLSSLKINADKTLYAQWTTNTAKVTFNYRYADKVEKQSYAAGETFSAPTPTRSGWTFLGWYTSATTPSEYKWLKVWDDSSFASVDAKKQVWVQVDATFNPTASSSYTPWSQDTLTNAKAHQLGSFAKYQIPLDAQLKIEPATGKLQYLKKTSNEVAPGKYETTSTWIYVDATLYAAWQKADKDQIDAGENKVPTDDAGNIISDFADEFTSDSVAAYSAAYKQYLAHKNQVGANPTDDQAATLLAELQAAQAKLVQVTGEKVYRLYNPYNHGDHLYTSSLKEYEDLQKIGWKGESVQFNVVSADAKSVAAGFGTAVYRVYNPYNGEHLLTTGSDEVDSLVKAGWQADNDGKPVFYAPQGGDVAVTRLFNPYETVGTHLYLTNQDEVASNVKLGWVEEEPVFYTR